MIGIQNTAFGVRALFNNRGKFNTAVGYGALDKNTSGQYNVAVGWDAGFALTIGSNNIDNEGKAGDNDTIRIGTQGTQTNTSIAGIYNNTGVTGLFVVIDSTGQLGVSTARLGAAVKSADAPKLRKEMQRQAAQIRDLRQQVAELKDLKQELRATLSKLQAKDALVAGR